MKIDKIISSNRTNIDLTIESEIIPDSLELETFKDDYSNIWAHLNHLYSSGDILSGKEYYTEDWFKQIASNHGEKVESMIMRNDEYHDLHIMNWSSDGLVCTVIDQNVKLRFTYPDNSHRTLTTNLAMVLLFQGDNWRVDALKILK